MMVDYFQTHVTKKGKQRAEQKFKKAHNLKHLNKALFMVSINESFKLTYNIHQRNHSKLVAYHNDLD